MSAATWLFQRLLNTILCVCIALIRGYQIIVSPWLPPRCRYWPSCSAYAIEALSTRGLLWGGYLSARRLLKCHPLGDYGYDPVPKKPDNSCHH